MYCGLKVIVVGSVVHGSSCCFCLSFFAWHRHGFAVCASLFLQLCVQLGMYASPRYVTIPTPPTHPPQPKGMCVCVQLGMCASLRYVTIPTHPPQPKGMCVCAVGNVCKSKVCYHPHPTHPPTPKVCVCVCMCVQTSPQKHVVCTDESDLCAVVLGVFWEVCSYKHAVCRVVYDWFQDRWIGNSLSILQTNTVACNED